MNHDEVRELIDAHVDGELDIVTARAVEKHLGECEECRALEQRIRRLREAVRQSAPAYRAPIGLRRDVMSALRGEAAPEGASWWKLLAIGATACALLLLGVGIFQSARGSRDAIVDEVVANHVRSLLATHLLDVTSSDQHTVKPWFHGKIDFAPEVRDFSADGFPLIGGRLDYLRGRPVVALVYQRKQHPINVFIEPASGHGDSQPSESRRRGYNVVHWRSGEMEWWAVSDLNMQELEEFTARLSH